MNIAQVSSQTSIAEASLSYAAAQLDIVTDDKADISAKNLVRLQHYVEVHTGVSPESLQKFADLTQAPLRPELRPPQSSYSFRPESSSSDKIPSLPKGFQLTLEPPRKSSSLQATRTAAPADRRAISLAMQFDSNGAAAASNRATMGTARMMSLEEAVQQLPLGQEEAQLRQIMIGSNPGITTDMLQGLIGDNPMNYLDTNRVAIFKALCDAIGDQESLQNLVQQTPNDACGQTATQFQKVFLGEASTAFLQSHTQFKADHVDDKLANVGATTPDEHGFVHGQTTSSLQHYLEWTDGPLFIRISVNGHEYCLEKLPGEDNIGFHHQSFIGRFDETQWAVQSGTQPIDLGDLLNTLADIYSPDPPGNVDDEQVVETRTKRATAYNTSYRLNGDQDALKTMPPRPNPYFQWSAVPYDHSAASARMATIVERSQAFK